MKAIQARIWPINTNFATELCECHEFACSLNTNTYNENSASSLFVCIQFKIRIYIECYILTLIFYSNRFAFNFVSIDEYKCLACQNKALFPIRFVSLFSEMRINFWATFFRQIDRSLMQMIANEPLLTVEILNFFIYFANLNKYAEFQRPSDAVLVSLNFVKIYDVLRCDKRKMICSFSKADCFMCYSLAF